MRSPHEHTLADQLPAVWVELEVCVLDPVAGICDDQALLVHALARGLALPPVVITTSDARSAAHTRARSRIKGRPRARPEAGAADELCGEPRPSAESSTCTSTMRAGERRVELGQSRVQVAIGG